MLRVSLAFCPVVRSVWAGAVFRTEGERKGGGERERERDGEIEKGRREREREREKARRQKGSVHFHVTRSRCPQNATPSVVSRQRFSGMEWSGIEFN